MDMKNDNLLRTSQFWPCIPVFMDKLIAKSQKRSSYFQILSNMKLMTNPKMVSNIIRS